MGLQIFKEELSQNDSFTSTGIKLGTPLPPELFDEFWKLLRILNSQNSRNRPPKIEQEDAEFAFTLLQDQDHHIRLKAGQQLGNKYGSIHINYQRSDYSKKILEPVKQFLEHPELNLVHVIRLFTILWAQDSWSLKGDFMYFIDQYFKHHRKIHQLNYDLLKIAEVLKALSLNPVIIGQTILDQYKGWSDQRLLKWEDESVYPYFLKYWRLLETGLEPIKRDGYASYEAVTWRKNTFLVLQTFPEPPKPLIPRLWEIALGTVKADRLPAQTCLDKLPNASEQIIVHLKSSDAKVRAIAAEWLARRGNEEAIASVQQALEKEKNKTTKDALMAALERLGQTVATTLDDSELRKAAEKGLKKGIPEALSWFPFSSLPIVRWEESDQPIDPAILTWLIVQSYKQKSTEPTVELRQIVGKFQQRDRQQLGQHILEAWIAQDTAPKYTRSEAEELAQSQATREYQAWQQIYQHHPTFVLLKRNEPSQQEIYQRIFNGLLNDCMGTAIKEKGILAIAAACCGASATPVVKHYLETWYGYRAGQCNALLQMLSWVEDFSAIQLLLAIANRFRTNSIRKEAEKCVKTLAERKSWTPEELSDRTIPAAGFEGNSMTLDYGSRQFTAYLDKKFSILLTDATGKSLKSLPDARKDDDEDRVKAAKKQLAEAKKQLKQVLTLQKDRLYEAMCVQRSWEFQTWNTFLNQHPIVRYYCQGLVWMGETTFRPLEDGTLTDVEDNEVAIAPDTLIRLAHPYYLSKELVQTWQTHFADYEIVPTFDQLNKKPYILSTDKQQTIEIEDFQGYKIGAFKLRSFAKKLGYVRGKTVDSGYFFDYKKAFPGLGLEVAIEFSGNCLPEEDIPVYLTILYCYKTEDADPYGFVPSDRRLPLSEIPPVLLSEVYGDLRAIALQGSGFDPDWERKSDY